jgi:hypothetical protein
MAYWNQWEMEISIRESYPNNTGPNPDKLFPYFLTQLTAQDKII